MPTTVVPRYVRRLSRLTSATLVAFLFLGALPESASAVSSWNPTLLVNTESFQSIDAGDGTTDIELRFGSTTNTIKFLNALQKFQFSKSLSVIGSISGSSLTIDGVASISGSLTVKNNIAAKGTVSGSTINGFGLGSCNAVNQKLIYNSATNKFECGSDAGASGSMGTGNVLTIGDSRYVKKAGDTMTGALNVRASISGSTLTISGQSNLSGALTVKGNVSAQSNLTINSDAGAVDADLTFGNASGNQTLKFLNSTQRFQFSRGISVVGAISGSSLSIDGNSTISGSLLVKNNIAAKGTVSGSTITGFGLGSCNGANQKLIYNNSSNKFECGTIGSSGTSTGNILTIGDARFVKKSGDTMTGALNVRASISGATLTVSGQSNFSGAVTVKNNITALSDLTINGDAGAVDAQLSFGNASGTQTLKFLNSSQKFQFSRGLSVVGILSGSQLAIDGAATISGALLVKSGIKTKGNLSGSTLTVDGNVTLHGVTYNAPSAQGAANTVLKNDGAGNLTWSNTIANGSGQIMSMHPDYPGAVYFASGASMIGQLTMSGGTVDNDNSYAWTTSRGTLQSYWISVRGRVPDNFSSWDAVKPIEFRYKTGVASAASNALRVLVKDTAGVYVPLSGHTGLASTAWTTAKITGPESAGTWTPKGYFTVYIQVAATNATNAAAYASFLNMNFESTNP